MGTKKPKSHVRMLVLKLYAPDARVVELRKSPEAFRKKLAGLG
jgi:hypothetical protein